ACGVVERLDRRRGLARGRPCTVVTILERDDHVRRRRRGRLVHHQRHEAEAERKRRESASDDDSTEVAAHRHTGSIGCATPVLEPQNGYLENDEGPVSRALGGTVTSSSLRTSA